MKKQGITTLIYHRVYVNEKFQTIKSLFGITAPYITPYFKDEMTITQHNKWKSRELQPPVDSWG
jgi:hypothetical protein